MIKHFSTKLRIEAAIFLVSLLVQLVYLYSSSAFPTFRVPIIDSDSYIKLARAWIDNGVMDLKFFWQPFFYPFFLSCVYYITGSLILIPRLIQSLIFALTCMLTYRLASRIYDRSVG